MSTWSPVTGLPIQYSEDASGTAASGNYLKFYASGTTTPINMATDSTGGTTLAKCQLNSLGQAINGSSAVFIPHVNQKYKAVLYPDSTTADANTFASAIWSVDGIDVATTKNFSNALIRSFATVAAAQAATDLVSGNVICIAARASSLWDVSGSGTANGYNVLALAGGLFATLRTTNYPNVKEWGAVGDGSTDDTGAIAAAFAADIAVCFPAPSSYYKTTAAIKIGDGNARFIIGASRYTTEIKNAVTDVFNVGGSNDATMFSMQELKVTSASGGGHCFDVKFTVSESTIENCWIKQENTGKSLWNQTVGYGGGNVVRKCRLEAAVGATVNPWYIYSSEIVNGLKVEDCRCDNSAGTKQFFFVSSSNTSSYNTNCVFRDLTFEMTYGGMIYLGGHQGSHIDNCHSYDMNTTQTGHGFYIGGSAGSIKSSRCKISRSGRRPSGSSLGAGICDVYLESGGAANTILESCYNSVGGATFTVEFQNNKALVIDRPSNSEASYSNDAGVTYIDINGTYEGIVAPAYHTTTLTATRELVIASGSITPTHLYHSVDTEGNGAADDLDTIVGTYMKAGDILTLRSEAAARVVTVKDGTGNLALAGDFALNDDKDVIRLLWNGTSWQEVSRSNNS